MIGNCVCRINWNKTFIIQELNLDFVIDIANIKRSNALPYVRKKPFSILLTLESFISIASEHKKGKQQKNVM